jgi:hypothetical protein
MDESKILYGDFRPSGVTKGIDTIPREKLSDIVADIKKSLLSDWSDVNFVIGSKMNT